MFTDREQQLVNVVKDLQQLLDIYTEAEGFTSVASKTATKVVSDLALDQVRKAGF